MDHDEIIDSCSNPDVKTAAGPSKSLGLRINGQSEHLLKREFSFAIVGDTSFSEDAAFCNKVHEYFSCPDIAALHLGSIEKEWSEEPFIPSSEIEYGSGKHLGITGCAKMISILQPRISVITEFGEELDAKNLRIPMKNTVEAFLPNIRSLVMPSDVGLALTLRDNDIYCTCMRCKRFVPVSSIEVKEIEGYLYYAYEAGCKSGHEHFDL
jgi:hypothetical protein